MKYLHISFSSHAERSMIESYVHQLSALVQSIWHCPNDMESRTEVTFGESDCGTKLCGAINTLQGRDAIKRGLHRLKRWACEDLMKCSMTKYTWIRTIPSINTEQRKDWKKHWGEGFGGVGGWEHDPSVCTHTSEGQLYLWPVILPFDSTLVRPCLEYCTSSVAPNIRRMWSC